MEITDLFDRIIKEQRSLDLAESEFRRMLVDEPELRREYRRWCRENEVSEKNGFLNYYNGGSEEYGDPWDDLDSGDNDY